MEKEESIKNWNKKAIVVLFLYPCFLIGMFSSTASAQIITTAVGTGVWGFGGDGGFATTAKLTKPYGLAIDKRGNLYIADVLNFRIRKVDTLGYISTVAGIGSPGFSGDGGLAINAELGEAWGIEVDHNGNIYIADTQNHRIRKIDTLGYISTIAGIGSSGFDGDGGQAGLAKIKSPTDIAIDNVGNIYITDYSHHRIRKIDTSGIINTIVGNGIAGFFGDGGIAQFAQINYPTGITLDVVGNIYFADHNNNRIRKIDTTNIITTVVITNGPWELEVQEPNIYFSNGTDNILRSDTNGFVSIFAGNGIGGYSGDGGLATAASLYRPYGVVADIYGNVFISDAANSRIRKVSFATGVDETRKIDNIEIVPNPSSETLTLKANGLQIIKTTLHNLSGQEIKTKSTNQYEYDVSDLAEGMYFLKIETAAGVLTKKVIVSR